MKGKAGKGLIVFLGTLGGLAGLYLVGIVSQLSANYEAWFTADGLSGKAVIKPPDRNFFVCIR